MKVKLHLKQKLLNKNYNELLGGKYAIPSDNR